MSDEGVVVSADAALMRLARGNLRFIRAELRYTRAPDEVLVEPAKEQRPFATILGCSDSRVPPELLFDTGFGELFVIRVAGNILSPEVMGSIHYAGSHLQTQLFLVLGHQGCGAVQAALAAKFLGARAPSRIQRLLEDILPGLEQIDAELPPELLLERAVEANVRWSIKQLLDTPEGRARTIEGRMKVVGAVCEIATGRVRMLA